MISSNREEVIRISSFDGQIVWYDRENELFEVGNYLGGGAAGTVYECEHVKTREHFALKILNPLGYKILSPTLIRKCTVLSTGKSYNDMESNSEALKKENVWWLMNTSIRQHIAGYYSERHSSLRELSLSQCIQVWGTDPPGIGEDDNYENNVELIHAHHSIGQRILLPTIPPKFADFVRRRNRIFREIRNMRKISCHRNVIRLEGVLELIQESKCTIFLVMELANGGELFDRIKIDHGTREDTANFFFQQLLLGVKHCHEQGVCHRDLKPENLLLQDTPKGTILKIADFGFSARFAMSMDEVMSSHQPSHAPANVNRHQQQSIYLGMHQTTNKSPSPSVNSMDQSPLRVLKSVVGSPFYVAPEVMQQIGYDGTKADVWSLGVILYAMLAGNLPFGQDLSTCNRFRHFAKWVKEQDAKGTKFGKPNEEPNIEYPSWLFTAKFSTLSKNLIVSMLHPDPHRRTTVNDAMNHPLCSNVESIPDSAETGNPPVTIDNHSPKTVNSTTSTASMPTIGGSGQQATSTFFTQTHQQELKQLSGISTRNTIEDSEHTGTNETVESIYQNIPPDFAGVQYSNEVTMNISIQMDESNIEVPTSQNSNAMIAVDMSPSGFEDSRFMDQNSMMTVESMSLRKESPKKSPIERKHSGLMETDSNSLLVAALLQQEPDALCEESSKVFDETSYDEDEDNNSSDDGGDSTSSDDQGEIGVFNMEEESEVYLNRKELHEVKKCFNDFKDIDKRNTEPSSPHSPLKKKSTSHSSMSSSSSVTMHLPHDTKMVSPENSVAQMVQGNNQNLPSAGRGFHSENSYSFNSYQSPPLSSSMLSSSFRSSSPSKLPPLLPPNNFLNLPSNIGDLITEGNSNEDEDLTPTNHEHDVIGNDKARATVPMHLQKNIQHPVSNPTRFTSSNIANCLAPKASRGTPTNPGDNTPRRLSTQNSTQGSNGSHPPSFNDLVKRSTRFITAVPAGEVLEKVEAILEQVKFQRTPTPIGYICKVETDWDGFRLKVWGTDIIGPPVCELQLYQMPADYAKSSGTNSNPASPERSYQGYNVEKYASQSFYGVQTQLTPENSVGNDLPATFINNGIGIKNLSDTQQSNNIPIRSMSTQNLCGQTLFLVEFIRGQLEIFAFKRFYQWVRQKLSELVKKDYSMKFLDQAASPMVDSFILSRMNNPSS